MTFALPGGSFAFDVVGAGVGAGCCARTPLTLSIVIKAIKSVTAADVNFIYDFSIAKSML